MSQQNNLGIGMDLTLYGMLYLDESDNININIKIKNFKSKIDLYLRNAVTLSKSLKDRGVNFVLITNNLLAIEQNKNYSRLDLQVEEISFTTHVPPGIKFYSAHFKLDVLRYLASLPSAYVGLCDLDMICINSIPECLMTQIAEKKPLFYDISEQVIPAYGKEKITRDIECILGDKSCGKWYGGEFIAGTPDFFFMLTHEINQIYDQYIANIDKIHHVGDEAITTAALEKMQQNGIKITDAGKLKIVGRFWSIKVLHEQKPFDWYKDCFLLHLPADKKFLASISQKSFIDVNEFSREFRSRNSWFAWLKR
jgi:hypothetical protein